MDLKSLIDCMPIPEMPDYFSESERKFIASILDANKQRARPYDGCYEATWLLSDFDDLQWITTNRGREECIDGRWKNVLRINWHIQLPNGEFLSDAKYSKLLYLNRRIAFLIRSGHVGEIVAPMTWCSAVAAQIQLTRWLVLNEQQFQPAEYGFKLFDQASLDSLLVAFSQGGWSAALQVSHRILGMLYQSTFGEVCPQQLYESVYNLPELVREKIAIWLSTNSFFGRVSYGVNFGKFYLRRDALADLICEPVSSMLVSSKFNIFCRQFEPELQHPRLLTTIFQVTEKPDQKTKTIEDVFESGTTENSLQSICPHFTTIFAAHRHCSEMMPEPSSVSIRSSHGLAVKFATQSGHKLFMPINIGLNYLNQAMRFVEVYGSAIIDFYLAIGPVRATSSSQLDIFEDLNSICTLNSGGFLVQVGDKDVPVAEALGIQGFRRLGLLDFDLLRKSPTLDEALRILIGACVVCIALLKPSREGELIHLKRNCLRYKEDGYYLDFSLGKSNVGEVSLDTEKPIPVIAAKAIQLLQKLGSNLATLFADKQKISGNLFYLPKLIGIGAMKANSQLLNWHIDIFCDYSNSPPDNFGRRWYVRVHEMRKWFLLLLFWSGRFDVLDAARWVAGHTDAKHIYAYIESEFPGEELPSLEAEYAVERLRALEFSGGKGTDVESGLDALYNVVLNHFGVSALSMVPQVEWGDYVSTLRNAEGFFLEPHSIYGSSENEVIGINVSFVLGEISK
jgi:hypothetical protein